MAKKKKPTVRRRRRRVSGMDTNGILMMAMGAAAGAAAAGILKKTVLAGKSQMMQAIIPMAAGAAIATFVKSDLGKFAGVGLMAGGATEFLKKFNIAGVGNDDESFSVPLMAGDDLNLIAGADDFAMAGSDEYDSDMVMSGTDGLTVIAGAMDDDDY